MKKNWPLASFAFLFILIVSISSSSCYKEPFYKAEITVQDTAGNAVPFVAVRLYAPVAQSELDVTDTTNENGIVKFDFELDAVLDISVDDPPYEGSGFIQLAENETVKETIIVRTP